MAKATVAKKPGGYSSEDDTCLHKSPDSELRSVVLAVQRGLRKARTTLASQKKDDLANKVCALLTKDGDAGLYTPIKPRRPPRRTPPSSVGGMASGHPGPSSIARSSGRKGASKALSGSFGDDLDHAMDNLRERIATRKEKKKQVAEGANKSQSSRGKASKDSKKATTDDEGRTLTKLIDRALHDISGETGEMDDAKDADCAALRPLALKLAKVYKPYAMGISYPFHELGLLDHQSMHQSTGFVDFRQLECEGS